MSATITVDATKFNLLIGDLHAAFVKAGEHSKAATVLRDSVRLFVQDWEKFTPPKRQAQGRKAVKQDLLGGRNVQSATGFKRSRGIFLIMQDWMPQHVGERTVRLWANKHGDVYGVEKVLYQPAASQETLKSHHLRFRSRRTGRTSLAGSWTRDVGRWKFINQMAVNKRAMNKYVREVQSHVGRMKAALTPALQELGGTVRGWVRKHGISNPSSQGYIFKQFTEHEKSFTIGMIAPGASKLERMVRDVMHNRTRAMAQRIRLILSGYAKDVARGIRLRTQ